MFSKFFLSSWRRREVKAYPKYKSSEISANNWGQGEIKFCITFRVCLNRDVLPEFQISLPNAKVE